MIGIWILIGCVAAYVLGRWLYGTVMLRIRVNEAWGLISMEASLIEAQCRSPEVRRYLTETSMLILIVSCSAPLHKDIRSYLAVRVLQRLGRLSKSTGITTQGVRQMKRQWTDYFGHSYDIAFDTYCRDSAEVSRLVAHCFATAAYFGGMELTACVSGGVELYSEREKARTNLMCYADAIGADNIEGFIARARSWYAMSVSAS